MIHTHTERDVGLPVAQMWVVAKDRNRNNIHIQNKDLVK